MRMSIFTGVRSALVLNYMLSILWIKRNPLTVIHLLATPFAVLFLLCVVGGAGYVGFALAGIIVMVLVYVGADLVSEAVWHRLTLKFQDMLVASPISRLSYMLGLSLSRLLCSSLVLVLLISFR